MAPNALPQSIIHRRGVEQPSDEGRGIPRAECDHLLITDRLLGSFLGTGDQEIRQGTSLKSGGPLKQLFLHRADASHEPMGFRWGSRPRKAVGERIHAREVCLAGIHVKRPDTAGTACRIG